MFAVNILIASSLTDKFWRRVVFQINFVCCICRHTLDSNPVRESAALLYRSITVQHLPCWYKLHNSELIIRLLVHFSHQPYWRCTSLFLQFFQTLQMLLKVLLSKLALELARPYCFLRVFPAALSFPVFRSAATPCSVSHKYQQPCWQV